jgi:putative CocE/NonD family hydrolase
VKKTFSLLFVCTGIYAYISAQQIYFPKEVVSDSAGLSRLMPDLAKNVIANYKDDNRRNYLNNLFRLQIIAGKYSEANATIVSLRNISKESDPQFPDLLYIQHELYSKAKLKQAATNQSFHDAFANVFNELFNHLDDKSALHIYTAFMTRNGVEELQTGLETSLLNLKNKDSVNINDAIDLCKAYYVFQVYKNIEPLAKQLLKEDDKRRYTIEDSVLIKTKEGATLSAVVVRKKTITTPQPTALFFTIYSDLDQNLYEAKQSATHGYAGMVADTRGKRLSPDAIEPYEHEAKDVNAVIDWISKQQWSNGKVGMYGGSYVGFAQWAATKYMHPALKTIVPYVAAIPGLGLPMENNVFLNANYGWAFFVTNNKYLDYKTYNEPQRWSSMQDRWYASGAPYRKIDSIDGTPNKWLQRWLQHPSYDNHWQNMVPYKNEYAKINIPVLTITGYYDDGQISALHYLKEHYKYNKAANHYLIIGPYDHFGAQRGGTPVLRDYSVDPVALIDTREITYQWLDHILKGGKKPELLKDKVNYEVMGANVWRHAASLEKMHNEMLTFYLTDAKSGDYYKLAYQKPSKQAFLNQEVNFADRNTTNNNDYYPYPIITQKLVDTSGLFFISEPFNEPVSIDGPFAGELKVSINKKDMDIGVVLYEVMPDGKYFHLSYFLGRASYAKDMSIRKLLTPGKVESIPFDRTRMVSRQLSKGSRLLVVLNINKNPDAQINYGTGKDVSDESIEDAKTPLRIKWYNDSFIKIPVWK